MGVRGGFDHVWANICDPCHGFAYGLGLVVDYANVRGNVNRHLGRFDVDQIYGSLYGTLVPKAIKELSFDVIVGGGYNWYESWRYHTTGTSLEISPGNTQGPQVDALFGVEYAFSHYPPCSCLEDFRFIPLATLQYVWIQVDGYTERCDNLSVFKINEHRNSSLESVLGFRSNYSYYPTDCLVIRPEISLGWKYEYLDTSFVQQGVALGSAPTPFSFRQESFNRNTLYVGADLRIESNDQFMVELAYDFFYNSRP